jgi:hypothetical protein
MSSVAALPAQPPAAGAAPGAPVPPGPGAHTPVDGGKTFDSFLAANQKSISGNPCPDSDPRTIVQEPPDMPAGPPNAPQDAIATGAVVSARLVPAGTGKVELPIDSQPSTPNAPVPGKPSKPGARPPARQSAGAVGNRAGAKPDDSAAAAMIPFPQPATPYVQQCLSIVSSPPLELETNVPAAPAGGETAVASSAVEVPQPPAAGQPQVAEGEKIPFGMSQSIAGEAAVDGKAAGKSAPAAATAKYAAPAGDPAKGAAEIINNALQPVETKVVADLPKTTGMSPAMQHTIMPDSKIQHADKTGATDLPASAADSAPAAVVAEKNAGNFTGGHKNEGGRQESQAPVITGLQAPAVADGTPPTSGKSLPGAAPAMETHQAASVVKQVMDTAADMRSDGRSNVELQMKLADGTGVAIKLQWRNGQVMTTFKTESSELRQAIEQNWTQFSSQSTERGVSVATPVFESPGAQAGANNLSQQQERQRNPGQTADGGAQEFPGRARQSSQVTRMGATPDTQPAAQISAGLEIYA